MSRIANSPVSVPSGVEVTINGADLNVKGAKGALQLTLHDAVSIAQEDSVLMLKGRQGNPAVIRTCWNLQVLS